MIKQLIAAVMGLALWTTAGADTFTVDGIKYNTLPGNTVEVAQKSPNYTGAITIPSTVTNNGTTYTVTAIGLKAFYAASSVTSVTLPESIVTLGQEAFESCGNLVSIEIPSQVKEIPSDCFYGDSKLTTVKLPEGLTTIGGWGFCSCPNLENINFPSSLKYIGQFSFVSNNKLKVINLGPNVSTVGTAAFASTKIEAINVDAANTVYSSFEGALYNKAQTELISFPPGKATVTFAPTVTTLTYRCLQGLVAKSVVVPNTVTEIGNQCFLNSYSLASITLGSGVQKIVGGAFYGCSSLTSINFPASVKEIGNAVVEGCTALATLTVDPANAAYCAENNILMNKAKTIILEAAKTITSATIPATVTTINTKAFSQSKLTSIEIPDGVKTLVNYAFQSCRDLTSVKFGTGLNSLPNDCFRDNVSLKSLSLPNNIKKLEANCFMGCNNLEKVIFGDATNELGINAFSGCSKLAEIVVPTISVPSISTSTFTTYGTTVVRVRSAMLEAFKAAVGWKSFTKWETIAEKENCVEAVYTGPEKIMLADGAVIPVTIKNTGSNEVTSIEYSVSIDGMKGEYSFDDISMPAGAAIPYEFPANLVPVGKHTIEVDIHTVNGVTNAADNKTLTISLEIAQGVTIPENAPMASYSNSEINTWYGGNNSHFDVAHLFADPQLVGKKVLGMKIDGISVAGVSNAKLWHSSSLSLSGGSFSANGETISVTIAADGSAKTAFSEPVTLTAAGAYFGISLDNDANASGADKWPVTQYCSDAPVKGGFMFHSGSNSYFSNYSEDGVLGVTLYLEDGAAVPAKALITSVDGHKANMPGKTSNLTVNWQNWSGAPVSSIDFSYTLNGTTHNETVTLPKATSAYLLQPHTFTMAVPAPTNAGEYPVDLCITKVNSTANPSVAEKSSFNYYVGAFQTTHKPMFEEFTGTGCGYCPRGTLAMNEMAKAYPDFIAAAYHGYNSGDPMYVTNIPGIFSGSAPAGIMDRKSGEIDPYYGTSSSGQLAIKKDYEAYRELLAPADMGLEATLNADSTITATGSMNFSYVDNGYALCFLLTIDGLNHQNDADIKAAWTQGNYYSGSNNDPLINSLCNGSYDMHTFNHVVIDCTRATNSNHWSKANFEVGKTYSATNKFDLNNCSLKDKSWLKGEDWSKINVIAFLKDDNGSIGNAVKVRLGQKIDAPTGIENLDAEQGEAAYYDLMGRRVQNPQTGIYIRVQNGHADKIAL